ncbi:rRNA maturation RNase YbeY [Chloroflexota bacterium]
MIGCVEISVLIEEGLEVDLEVEWLISVAEQVLVAEGVSSTAELSLVITSQERIRELNRLYLGRDRPTDVIAFHMLAEQTEGLDLPAFVSPPDGMRHLGEVVISYPQAVIQAEEQGHSVKKEMTILVIHGVLHLLGYGDEEPGPKRTMSAREAEILPEL